jgi:protease-4
MKDKGLVQMKKNICFILLFLLVLCQFIYADPLPKSVFLPSASVAVRDDAMATVLNPAGLGVNRGTDFSYVHTLSGDVGGDNAFFISAIGTGFGAELVDRNSMKFNKYTLSDGAKLSDSVYFGIGYSWFNSKDKDYDSLSSWDIGLLTRPSNALSLGLVARNITRPSFKGISTDRSYDISLALRPFTNRITLSLNSILYEKHSLKDADFDFALDFEPIDGLLLRGSYNRDGDFEMSVGMGLQNSELGTYRRFDEDRNGIGGGVYARLSSEWNRSKFPTEKYVLEMDSMDTGLIQKAKNDESIKGIMIKPNWGEYSMGSAQEMREAINDFKSSGKKAICYMEIAGNKEYYIASSCDQILMNPAGSLALYGLRSEVTSYKGTLDKIGVEADLYHIGKYKSASEMFTDYGMSDAHRESLNSMLDDLHEQMVSGIASDRKVSVQKAQEWIDNGPYTASEAKKVALVDDLVYSDKLGEVANQVTGMKINKLSAKEYRDRRYHNYDWTKKPRIAVIYASGFMLPGKSMLVSKPSVVSVPSIMGSDTIKEAIKNAREDDSVKAIILRVDTGGGSVFASDLIWREITLTKGKKPFIVSMGDVAASGGYYISCLADAIVAEPGTITGSIGVITGKFSLQGLYEKLGIKKEILKKGKNADIYSDYSTFTDEQKEIVNRQMGELYNDFVKKVSEGRKMSKESVESIAQGRAWTGRQAKENGLVDNLGGLQLAIAMAKEKANIKENEIPDIMILPKSEPLWQRFALENVPLLNEIKSISEFIKIEKLVSRDVFFYLIPYSVDYE